MNQPQVILPLCAFGNDVYMHLLLTHHTIIDMGEHFTKQTWRNRYDLAGPNGIHPLTIPVVSRKGQKVPAAEVQIDHKTNWRDQHLKSIRAAYGSAPFFEHYMDSLSELYTVETHLLCDWNKTSLSWTLKQLKTEVKLGWAEKYVDPTPEFYDLRKIFKPSAFGKLHTDCPAYLQVFTDRYGFRPHCSVLDSLFNLGPDAALWLRNIRFDACQITNLGG